MKTVSYENGILTILDQSKLPEKVEYLRCHTPEEVADAILDLKVRGAPLIGVTAAYALALGMVNYHGNNKIEYFEKIYNLLASTRPTAVNLFWAINRIKKIFLENSSLDNTKLANILINEVNKMFKEDINTNKLIGEHGEKLLNLNSKVLTICNAGALATCGYGTALGVIRTGFRENKIKNVWACETRPVLQGSRLTVWELLEDNIPVTLITDSMAAYIMSLEKVDAVIVGADRIAANGDTANKIGTYSLAIAAHYHSIPFYVAAPTSTIDLTLTSGTLIPIEQRNADEIRQLANYPITHQDVEVFNPSFDVTPNEFITAIICEKGIIKKPFKQEIINFMGEEE
ncbi:S-methyl-5-thioribose-1-phosphate isomerase [Candidatus Syntrophocurvum alkaliphilum]|uniref:S-methyl-5-thioribose-1-phosphate isomerase n=1 Tax=Candidatus Syntrophocurvum alkaliphilum TaxID=2293317 RepID=UPI0018CF1CBA|nr:S-methyl-5-thioribose-1-phosphate isomerase [Candidatus Syntrophocurvum alkaliphilum]